MADIKIADMDQWSAGVVPGGALIPFVYLNENFVAALSQLLTGATGTFTTADAKTVTVVSGLIVSIV